MAEEVLVGQVLTTEMIKAGEELLKEVQKSDLDVTAAFWLYFAESGEWRLVLVSPRVDTDGPKKLYSRLSKLLYRDGLKVYGLDSLNITFVSPNDRLVRAIANTGRLADLSGKRLSGANFSGEFVDDIYIYFIGDPAEPSDGRAWYTGNNPL